MIAYIHTTDAVVNNLDGDAGIYVVDDLFDAPASEEIVNEGEVEDIPDDLDTIF